MKTARFVALRNFLRRPGEHVLSGDVLELDDAEAALFVSMPGTVEPVDKRDRSRIVSTERVTWDAPADHEQRSAGGSGGWLWQRAKERDGHRVVH